MAFTALAIALGFIPTILTKLNTNGFIYYDTTSAPLQQFDPVSQHNWPSVMPVLDNFVTYLQNPSDSAIDEMMKNYLQRNLLQNISSNPTGVWFDVKHKPSFNYTDRQYGTKDGFSYGGPTQTYNAFGLKPGDHVDPTSLSLDRCVSGNNNTFLYVLETGLPSIKNHTVHALYMYPEPCYPVYDRTASVFITTSLPNRASVLSSSDSIYRGSVLNPGITGLGSFAVSLFNHNKTHMSMGIKKMASITMYNYNKSITLPSDCSDTGKSNINMNFKDLPYNYILCNLFSTMSAPNSTYKVLQAAGKHYQSDNHAVNAVYTIQEGHTDEEGQSVMVDLNAFAVYTVEGQMSDDNEHLLAYQTKSIGTILQANKLFEVTLANDNIGYILSQLDPAIITSSTIDVLVAMVSMRARWSNNDFSDFVRVSAKVMDGVETPRWWIIVIIVLFILFLLPQLTKLSIRRIPHYGNNFRTVLISSLEENNNTKAWKGKVEPRRIELAISSGHESNESPKVVHLKVDGTLISRFKGKEESSLIDEKSSREYYPK